MKSRKTSLSKILFYGSFVVLALLFIISNLVEAEKTQMKKEKLTFENVIDDYEKKVAEADYFFNVIEWNSYLNSNDDGMAKLLDEYERKFQNLINDETNFRRIKALKEKYAGKDVKGVKRDITDRWYGYLDKLIVLDPEAKKLQERVMELKNNLSKVWNVYRPKMKDEKGRYIKDGQTGKDRLFNGSEIRRILSGSDSRDERRRAFEAQSAVGFRLEKEGFKKLIKERNKFAQKRGYKDFYNMKYRFSDLDEDRIFDMFDRIVKETDKVTKHSVDNFLKEKGYSSFEPWDADYASLGHSAYIDKYLTKEGLIKTLKDSYKGLGIDLEGLNIMMDLEPRAGKFPHAACWGISPAEYRDGKWQGEESRIMANIDKGGIDQYDTLFHEMGHAVHDVFVRQNYTINNNLNLHYLYDMGPFIEGIAYIFQKIPYEKEWGMKYAQYEKPGKTKAEFDEIGKAYAQFQKAMKPWEAFNLRSLLVKVYFERDIYKESNPDLNEIWWKHMNRLLFVDKHEDLPHWSHKMHFITHPAYYQFYVLADLISEQTLHHFKKEYGKIVDNPKVGELLVKYYFNPGASLPWEKMLENLTGEKLNVQYRIDSCTKL